MAAVKVFDAAVKTRSYQDPRTGEKKGVYQNVGAVWKGDDGNQWLTLYRWFTPAGIPTEDGRDSISVSLFAPKPNGQ
jgi:hypothetical protein